MGGMTVFAYVGRKDPSVEGKIVSQEKVVKNYWSYVLVRKSRCGLVQW